jgi:hypothetical protein
VIAGAPFSSDAGAATQMLDDASAGITATGNVGSIASVTGSAGATSDSTTVTGTGTGTVPTSEAGASQTSTKSGAIRAVLAGNTIWFGGLIGAWP